MQFSYKKNTKKMLYAIVIMPFIIWLISLLLLFYAPPLYKKAEYWSADIFTIKEHNFQQRDKSKNSIYFISGSNGVFGISSRVLEEKFDYNIQNLASHANLPLIFYFNLVKKYAQTGDVVIAPLEYVYHTKYDSLGLWGYDQFTTWASHYQSLLSPKMQRELLKRNMYSYWERLPFFYRALPVTKKELLIPSISKTIFSQKGYQGLFLTRHGEFFLDYPSKIFDESAYFTSEKVTQIFIDELIEFNTYAKKHGIKFYVTYSISRKNELFDTDAQETQKLLKDYEQIFSDAGINFFGTDSFYNLDAKYFYDSIYHLNATGAVLRSLLLAEEINIYVLGKEPSYDTQSEKDRDEFFKEKEKEALEIMVKLRKEDKKLKEQKVQ